MLKYREFMSLTDEEITEIIKDIFPNTSRVDNIKRFEKWERIECDIYIIEEYPDIADTLELVVPSEINPVGINTHDFNLTVEEYWKWSQWLLAKGVDDRLKDNPYIEKNIEKLNLILEDMELYTVGRVKKNNVCLNVEDLQQYIDHIRELI